MHGSTSSPFLPSTSGGSGRAGCCLHGVIAISAAMRQEIEIPRDCNQWNMKAGVTWPRSGALEPICTRHHWRPQGGPPGPWPHLWLLKVGPYCHLAPLWHEREKTKKISWNSRSSRVPDFHVFEGEIPEIFSDSENLMGFEFVARPYWTLEALVV